MKSVFSSLAAIGSLVIATSFASTSFAAFDCNISSGAANTVIEVLVIGEYTIRFDEVTNMKMIYSCGPFVATGAGDAAEPREIVEIEPNACSVIQTSGQNDVIYCRP